MRRISVSLLIVCSLCIICAFIACSEEKQSIQEIDAEALSNFLQARGSYSKGDLSTAEKEFRRLALNSPSFFQARLMLGKTLFLQEKTTAAEEVLVELLADFPAYREAQLWLLRCLYRSGRLEEAGVRLDALLAYDPQDPRLLYQRALVYEEREELEHALETLSKAALFREEFSRVFLDLGRLYHRFALSDPAVRNLETSLALLPEKSAMRPGVSQILTQLRSQTASPKSADGEKQ